MGSSEIHNVQITLTQIPRVQKAVEAQYNNPQNQAQTLAALENARRTRELTKVKELTESEATEAEKSEKDHLKKKSKHQLPHIDIKI